MAGRRLPGRGRAGPQRLGAANQATVQKVVDALVATMHWINTHSAAQIADAMPASFTSNGITTKAAYTAELAPTLPPFGLADGVAGLAGAIAVLLALYDRDRNGGRGQVIDVSLIEPLLTILGPGPSVFDQLQVPPGRHGNRSPNNAPRNTYRTRDGRWVAVSTSAGVPTNTCSTESAQTMLDDPA
jgi:crotonobetainyl-CoA:carnitine CoA-transferase CaiB-like acyl-CoA transferase